MDDMSRRHQDQFHVVRLNGFIHTDDKLALREIWRQLGREMEVEDELVNKVRFPDVKGYGRILLTGVDYQSRRYHGLSARPSVASFRDSRDA
jgi:hypothetical protein